MTYTKILSTTPLFLRILLFAVFVNFQTFSQNEAYYSAINPSSGTFITDLKTRVRSPYTQISYAQFDETNVANFASFSNGDGTRTVYCVYSHYPFVYTPPFAWTTFSREHTWCHSWMPSYSSTGTNEYQDQHHLFPTQQNNANGVRSNHPLGNVANVTSSFYECKYGTNTLGQNVFEPRKEQKGDAARALLYMCIRYDGVGGLTWNFNWLNGTRLPSISEAPQDLSLLLQWHQEDPPDAWEVERNDYIESIQGNRNPFVDHPEYSAYINFNNLSLVSPSFATEPTNFCTGLTATANGTSVTVSWTDAVAGTQVPSNYLLEAYSSDYYFIPVDGAVYSDRTSLATDSARITIGYNAANSYTFTGLSTGKTYYFRMYSSNGSGTATNYKTIGTIPTASVTVTGTTSLAVEPTNYVTAFSSGPVTANAIPLTWTDAASGTQPASGYLLYGSNTNSFTNPTDGVVYPDDIDMSDGSVVVNISSPSAGGYTLTGLNSTTTYYFRLYSFNGNASSRNYKTDGLIPATSATTLAAALSAEPSNHVTGLSRGDVTTYTMQVTWTDAVSGAQSPSGYILFANTNNTFTTAVDGNTYTDDANLADGNAIVHIAAPSSGTYTFTGLNANTTYYIRLYSYNGSGTQRNYKTDGVIPQTSGTTTELSGNYQSVLLDDFNRSNNNVLGNVTAFANGPVWGEQETVAGSGNQINSNRLELGGNVAGRDFATIDLSQINGYPAILANAAQTLTWALNMRQSRSDPSGFDAGNYGIAFILGKSDSLLTSSSGYAVTLGESGSTDAIRFRSFTGGIAANSRFTNLLVGSTVLTNSYISLKITFVPASKTWSLYAENSASAYPQADPRNTATLIGSIVDTSYVSSNLKYLGLLWNHSSSATDKAYFDDLYITAPETALPVELTSFSAETQGEYIILRWKTATEANNYGFAIERSIDGTDWEQCGFVAGKGNSFVENQYAYTDKWHYSSEAHYRLKQIDNDGKYAFSKIVTVSPRVVEQFALFPAYPNPFNPNTILRFSIPITENVNVTVYDVMGKEVAVLCNEQKFTGVHTLQFQPDNLSSGMYVVVLRAGAFKAAQKLLYIR